MRQHRRRAITITSVVLAIVTVAACGRPAFVPYAPTTDLVPKLSDASPAQLGGMNSPSIFAYCDANEIRHWVDPGPNASEWRMVIQRPQDQDQARTVSFQTRRFTSRDEFDDAVTQVEGWFAEPCISSDDTSVPEVEPIKVEGLPDGAISARWDHSFESAGPLSTVIVDDDRLLMMVVVWVESPEAVPVDDFAQVVNTAWSTFQSDNS